MIITPKLSDVEIVSLPAPETVPLGFVADESVDQILRSLTSDDLKIMESDIQFPLG